MTTKLSLYRETLLELGLRSIDDTGEDVEGVRVLNHFYQPVINYCLEAGQWNWATRTIKVDADTGIDPGYGYERVFAKPNDWVRTIGISADEYNRVPLTDLQYKDENQYWLTDITPIYVRYISNDTGYGFELSTWPESFARYVVMELASRACERLTQSSSKREELVNLARYAKRNALSKDAMNQGSQVMLSGRLVTARLGTHTRDRGSRSRFTG